MSDRIVTQAPPSHLSVSLTDPNKRPYDPKPSAAYSSPSMPDFKGFSTAAVNTGYRDPHYFVSDTSTPPSHSLYHPSPTTAMQNLVSFHRRRSLDPAANTAFPQGNTEIAASYAYGAMHDHSDSAFQQRHHGQHLPTPPPNAPVDFFLLQATAPYVPNTIQSNALVHQAAYLQEAVPNYGPSHAAPPYPMHAHNPHYLEISQAGSANIHPAPPSPPPPPNTGAASWGLGVSGSLDPSTGVFSQTVDHPRMRTAQACERCRSRKAKVSVVSHPIASPPLPSHARPPHQ